MVLCGWQHHWVLFCSLQSNQTKNYYRPSEWNEHFFFCECTCCTTWMIGSVRADTEEHRWKGRIPFWECPCPNPCTIKHYCVYAIPHCVTRVSEKASETMGASSLTGWISSCPHHGTLHHRQRWVTAVSFIPLNTLTFELLLKACSLQASYLSPPHLQHSLPQHPSHSNNNQQTVNQNTWCH